jgi:hypothetical protein
MKLFNPKLYTQRKNYRAERMNKIRNDISRWLNEYEEAKTSKHREVCMDMIQRSLRQYEWYGKR